MSHTDNKLRWCLDKAKKESEKGKNHKGLMKIRPDKEEAYKHIAKAEHYLGATEQLKKGYSDISASTAFYSMYHCLLAIAAKFGYDSRN